MYIYDVRVMVPSSLDTVVTRLGVVGTGTLGRAGGSLYQAY